MHPDDTLEERDDIVLAGVQNHRRTQTMLLISLLQSETLKLSERDVWAVCVLFLVPLLSQTEIWQDMCPGGKELSKECMA